MTIKNAYRLFLDEISGHYSFREAQNMAKIVFEDEFGVTNFEREDTFSKQNQNRLKEIEQRLVGQEPLQYILGQADFFGLKFKVDHNVLIPRPETEELVFLVLNHIRANEYDQKLKILDIGTGSGCIPIALGKENSSLEIHATDVSSGAIKVALGNAGLNQVKVRFFENDILDQKAWSELHQYDIIISNPPYIPHSEDHLMPLNVKKFEPARALFVDDNDPLIFYRVIAQFATKHLNKGGHLFFETNEFNAREVLRILELQGFVELELIQDISGKDRMIKAKGKA